MKPLRNRLQEARKRLGLPWEILEKDYVLSWLLAGISDVESESQQFMTMAGTASDFSVVLDTEPGAGKSYTFIVRKNGVDTPVTCTISGMDTLGSDLTDSVSFASGDYIVIMVTPSGNPTAAAMCWTAKFLPGQ